MPTLRRRLGQQTQGGRDELPLFVADIAGLGASVRSVHAPMLRTRRCRFITPSQIAFIVAFGVLHDTIIVRSLLILAITYDISPKILWPSRG